MFAYMYVVYMMISWFLTSWRNIFEKWFLDQILHGAALICKNYFYL